MRLNLDRFLLPGIALIALSLTAAPVWAVEGEGGVEEVDAAWLKAFNGNDLDGVMACYAPDAVAWLPEAPQAKGADAIRATYKGLFANYTVTEAKLTEAHYATVGDRSVGWGTYSVTFAPKAGGGAPAVMTGRFTEIAERRGDRWVYVVDHASPDPPATDAKAK